MKKLLPFAFFLSPLLLSAQDLPLYDSPQQANYDPDVWHRTRMGTGQRHIELYYTSLPEIVAANVRQAEQQKLAPDARRAKLHRDSTEYAGGVMFISATCPDRTSIDGALTVVVLDEQQQEVLRRTLGPGEAELSVSAKDFGRIYTVPISKPLPANAVVQVVDNPARQHHQFLIRPVSK